MRHFSLGLVVVSLFTLGAGPSSGPTSKPSVLPFIVDDYPKALAEARARQLPLFIDTWAPWCHTCRSMQAFVFTDEALREQAGRFVWLEIDTEKAQNAAFRKQYPARALPTYFVVEPDREKVVLRWVGGATVTQLKRLLDDSRTNFDRVRSEPIASAAKPSPVAVSGTAAPGAAAGPSHTADDLLAQADLSYGEGKTAEAAELFQRAIAAAPEAWPGYPHAVEAVLVGWSLEEEYVPAVRFAREVYPRVAKTPSVAVVAGVGLDCAVALPQDDPAKAEAVAFFEEAARKAVADRSIPMADDDRSGVYISLLSARQAAGDSTGERAVVGEWAAFLDGAAERAPTPAARAVFDSHRLSAYVELGQAEKAIPMLEASQRDFPDDYNPPARLAVAYKALGRWDAAIAASDRALEHGYGPRLLNILRTRSDIFLAKGDTTSARATLEDAARRAEALPDGQRSESTIEGLRKKLMAITPAPEPPPVGN